MISPLQGLDMSLQFSNINMAASKKYLPFLTASPLQGPDISVEFPNIKAILWFDEIKVEAQAGGAIIDWRFTGNQQIQSGLDIYLQVGCPPHRWLVVAIFVAMMEIRVWERTRKWGATQGYVETFGLCDG